ncbi:MAG TPA: D-alanine--D-alanine ligase [Candidatus Saccharimonadales bacterium]|nr:D-alanine--D-alanine ligase [Candidatus Saccharimonadales bacterium]
MKKIIVLAGGVSGEREVSLRSGAAVANALKAKGYKVSIVDPANNFEAQRDEIMRAEVVFPVLHGIGGEDGDLQALLDIWDVRYVGSAEDASRLCFDKVAYKTFLRPHGIPFAKDAVVNQHDFWQSKLIKKPFVLKPFDGGSSLDTYIIRDVKNVPHAAIDASFAVHDTMLLEELIEGIEITVAVVGTQAMPVIEIIPPASGEFDYENKYNGKTQELCPPKSVPVASQKIAQELAERIHKLCGCRDLSRTDMICRTDGSLVVLETNTLPGMTDQSLLPKAAAQNGMPMPELVDYLVKQALLH